MCPPKRFVKYFYTIPSRNLQEIDGNYPTKVSQKGLIPDMFIYENG